MNVWMLTVNSVNRRSTATEQEAASNRQDAVDRAEPATKMHDSSSDLSAIRDRLVRLAYRFIWDREEAEDVAHETLIVAQERADSLRDKRKWWSWVCQILVRRCQERGRRRQIRQRHASTYAVQKTPHFVQTDEENSAESTAEVAELLRRLPARQYEVVVLRHLENMGYQEIADTLGISVATARVHARAGRETLRTLLIPPSDD